MGRGERDDKGEGNGEEGDAVMGKKDGRWNSEAGSKARQVMRVRGQDWAGYTHRGFMWLPCTSLNSPIQGMGGTFHKRRIYVSQ